MKRRPFFRTLALGLGAMLTAAWPRKKQAKVPNLVDVAGWVEDGYRGGGVPTVHIAGPGTPMLNPYGESMAVVTTVSGDRVGFAHPDHAVASMVAWSWFVSQWHEDGSKLVLSDGMEVEYQI